MRRILFAIVSLSCWSAFASNWPVDITTNTWRLGPVDTIESVAFVMANQIVAEGRTLDDSFWLAQNDIVLKGDFGNDVWALTKEVKLDGIFRDHVRVVAQNVLVNGSVSNGLWAVAGSINTATNAVLYGYQFLFADQLSLLGHIEGDVYAKAHSITIGGTIVGNLHLTGDDIVIRPGTTIIGDLNYLTTNQSIVLDSNSQVSGAMNHLPAPAITTSNPLEMLMVEMYFFIAAIAVGIPMMLAFPDLTGHAVRNMRVGLWKCGLIGITLLFGAPFAVIAIAFTVVGLPLAAVTGGLYALIVYLGKFITALAIGSALLQKRGQISLSGALLSLVTGLLLYYSLVFIPVIGSSLQATATAFGAGGLILAAIARRGRVSEETGADKHE